MKTQTALLAAALTLWAAPGAAQDYFWTVTANTDGQDLLTRVAQGDPDPASNESVVGRTGTSSIDALARHPRTGELYVVNDDQLGVLDARTAAWSPRPQRIGAGDGTEGYKEFVNVDALAFDHATLQLFGIVVEDGYDDLLIEIDPQTGAAVEDVFGGDDYLHLEKVGGLDDVTGIAIHPQTGALWGTYSGTGQTRLARLDRGNGDIISVIRVDGDIAAGDLDIDTRGRTWIIGQDAQGQQGIWQVEPQTGAVSNRHSCDDGVDYQGLAAVVDEVIVPDGADVAVTISATPLAPTTGRPFVVRVNVRNRGPATARDTTVTLSGPPQLVLVDSQNDRGTYNARTDTWLISTLATQVDATLELTFEIPVGAVGQTVEIGASATHPGNDPSPDNNDATLTATVRDGDTVDPDDFDGDGLGDTLEDDLGTDPTNPDTDGDGRPDGDEIGPNPDEPWNQDGDDLIDANDPDDDGDGIDTIDEVLDGTDPDDADTDNDGVIDGEDGVEDTDGDGIINALDPDSDNDGLLDGTEVGVTDAQAHGDTDTTSPNFVPDADPSTTTDPTDADTDDGGVFDGREDENRNGRVDAGETDPLFGEDDIPGAGGVDGDAEPQIDPGVGDDDGPSIHGSGCAVARGQTTSVPWPLLLGLAALAIVRFRRALT